MLLSICQFAIDFCLKSFLFARVACILNLLPMLAWVAKREGGTEEKLERRVKRREKNHIANSKTSVCIRNIETRIVLTAASHSF